MAENFLDFQLKNPRKGTETRVFAAVVSVFFRLGLSIKESPEGDWNFKIRPSFPNLRQFLSIKESPEGDWNEPFDVLGSIGITFQLKNPRKGTETFVQLLVLFPKKLSIKQSPEGDWNADLP